MLDTFNIEEDWSNSRLGVIWSETINTHNTDRIQTV